MPSEEIPRTEFLNVDLDLYAQDGLEQFLENIRSSVTVLHQSPEFISLELANFVPSAEPSSPERYIRAFISLINALPPEATNIWKRFDRRSFNIGVQAGTKPHSTCFTISSAAIAQLAGLDAEIAFTVYAPPEAASAVPTIAEVGR